MRIQEEDAEAWNAAVRRTERQEQRTMEITDYRGEIDTLDQELIKTLEERMRICEKIAQLKKEQGVPVEDPLRERALLDRVTEASAPELAYDNRILFGLLLEESRAHQRKIIGEESDLVKEILRVLAKKPEPFPDRAVVAVQGVQGAYSQEACDRFFKMPQIMYMKNFRGVFASIESGLCRYGILPIENSTAGSVNQVYDLMLEYRFYIVKSMKVKISHCLLAGKGTRKDEIREIFSHEQAIAQCETYLKQFPKAKVTICENTAEAAKMVAESGRKDAAAIASGASGRFYGLDTLEESVQDNDNNYTRFICITKDLEIDPGANKTSLMMVIDDKPGSLYRVLARFNAMGINLRKLESRPMPSSDFEFMFYFDIDESVYSDAFVRMMSQLEEMSVEFKYLGSYCEI